jgi:primosomal protein N' (replication factor Y)
MEPLFTDVILPLPLPQLFTYEVTDEWRQQAATGKRVLVQFGSQKIYAGLVYRLHQNKPKGYVAKKIISVLDDLPVVTAKQFELWEWISEYYLCNLGDVMQAALPAAFKLSSETKIILNPNETDGEIQLTDDEFLVTEALHSVKSLSLKEISKILDRKYVFPVVKSLLRKNVVLSVEDVKADYKIPLIAFVSRSAETQDETFLKKQFELLEKKAPRQLDILMQLMVMEESFENKKVPQKELLKKSNGTLVALQQLAKKNLVSITREKETEIKAFAAADFYVLNAGQLEALAAIKKSFEEKTVTLLHGVTSSGKTELYIRLIDECLQAGKQAIYLLPEIALTTQIISRLTKHFGNRLLVYHSRFTDNERAAVWTKLIEAHHLQTEPVVIIGARSSVFLPFYNPGLIIVDEEHETSFKQFDPAPRYHARDTAVLLASLHKANTLLGSATPSIESYYNAQNGKYGWVELYARHADIAPPEIKLVNIKELTVRKQMKSHFSPLLLMRIEQELAKKKQIILFQNRRGFAPIIQCNHCQWIPHCINCDVALTYYKKADILRCHYCGYSTHVPGKCSACGDHDLRQHGFGTEKIEDELQLFFPDKKIARLDLDATRGKHAYKEIIQRFENRETDMLVGTQMITKGLDFDNVSLVGILNADSLINFPDFRAFERSFQMLMQVSGRAGRKNEQGSVIIQTYNPAHSVLEFVVNNDYKGFIAMEMAERKKFRYPPYYRLTEMTLRAKDEEQVNQSAKLLVHTLKAQFGNAVLGPVTPFIARIKNYYLRTLLLKTEKSIPSASIRRGIKKAFDAYRSDIISKNVYVHVDVDPV